MQWTPQMWFFLIGICFFLPLYFSDRELVSWNGVMDTMSHLCSQATTWLLILCWKTTIVALAKQKCGFNHHLPALVQSYAIIILEQMHSGNQMMFSKTGYPKSSIYMNIIFHELKKPALGVPRLRETPNIAPGSGLVKVEIRMDSLRRSGVTPRTRTRNGSSAIQHLGVLPLWFSATSQPLIIFGAWLGTWCVTAEVGISLPDCLEPRIGRSKGF